MNTDKLKEAIDSADIPECSKKECRDCIKKREAAEAQREDWCRPKLPKIAGLKKQKGEKIEITSGNL